MQWLISKAQITSNDGLPSPEEDEVVARSDDLASGRFAYSNGTRKKLLTIFIDEIFISK